MKPLLFFGIRFLGISLLAFAFWQPFTQIYPYAVVPGANALLWCTGEPIRLVFENGGLAAMYDLQTGPFRIWMGNQDVIYLNLIVLVGLFGAWGMRAQIGCMVRFGIAVFALWITHAVHAYLLAFTGLWHYFRQAASAPGVLPDHLRAEAEAAAQILPAYTQLVQLNLALDFWRNWGMMALAFVLWLALVGPQIRKHQNMEITSNAS